MWQGFSARNSNIYKSCKRVFVYTRTCVCIYIQLFQYADTRTTLRDYDVSAMGLYASGTANKTICRIRIGDYHGLRRLIVKNTLAKLACIFDR